ncbi:MAG: lipoprotein-releasing ABC transporter permease subunit [Aeromonadaceae bacterium]|nr:lipoprotein-releasing ABC transporter permease subunit [Aeromonadaceae bacterium]
MTFSIFQPLSLAIGLRYAGARGEDRFASFVSLFSTFGIAIGVAALIVVSSVMNGFEGQLKGRILGVIPHAVLSDADGRLSHWQALAETLPKQPHELARAPLIRGEVMAQSPGQLTAISLMGIDPAAFPAADRLAQQLGPELLAKLTPGSFNIIVGSGIARRLTLLPGDPVRLLSGEGSRFTPLGRVPSQRLFTLVGSFEVRADVDEQVALVHLEDARRLLRYGPEQVSGLRLWLDDAFAVSQIQPDQLPDGLVLHDWRAERGELFRAVAMEKHLMSLMLVLIIMVAAFNILSALVMVVLDKQGEVAILRTMGLETGAVLRIFMVQGAWSGIMGGLFGTLLGCLLAAYLNQALALLGLNLYMAAGGQGLPVVMLPGQIALISLGGLLISFLATLYPAYRAAAIRPAEALRYE